MATNNKVGRACKLYIDTGTVHATPMYALVERVTDLNVNVDFTEVAFNSRVSDWTAGGYGGKTLEATFGYEFQSLITDTIFVELRDAFLTNLCKRFLVLDDLRATTGAQGWEFYANVAGPSLNQSLDEGYTQDYTLRLARFFDTVGAVNIDPIWTVI